MHPHQLPLVVPEYNSTNSGPGPLWRNASSSGCVVSSYCRELQKLSFKSQGESETEWSVRTSYVQKEHSSPLINPPCNCLRICADVTGSPCPAILHPTLSPSPRLEHRRQGGGGLALPLIPSWGHSRSWQPNTVDLTFILLFVWANDTVQAKTCFLPVPQQYLFSQFHTCFLFMLGLEDCKLFNKPSLPAV